MATRRGGFVGLGTNWNTILAERLSLIQVDAGQRPDLSVVDAATAVVDALHTRRRSLRGELRKLGNALGDLGWPLDQLNSWLEALASLTKRSHRGELRS